MASSTPSGTGSESRRPLPNELILEVLEFLCADLAANPIPIPNPLDPITNSISLAPIATLRLVSHLVRGFVESQRHLWMSYSLLLPSGVRSPDIQQIYDGLRYYLRRAPPVELISFGVEVGAGLSPAYWLRQLLFRYAPRLESLTLHISSETLGLFQGRSPPLFQSLRRLSVILPERAQQVGFVREVEGLLETLHNAQQLSVLSISLVGTSRAPRLLFIDGLPLYNTLTTLIVTHICVSVTDSQRFWLLCPQLESCTFWLAPFSDEVGVPPTTARLASLRQLHITYRFLSPEPFASLEAPQLVMLVISVEASENNGAFPDVALRAFQARSHFELAEFHLHVDFSGQAQGVLQFLEAAPTLQTLTLHWTLVLESRSQANAGLLHLLASLARPHLFLPNKMDLLPALRSLQIDLVSPYMQDVLELLRSRVDQLSEVTLYDFEGDEVYWRQIWDLRSRNRHLNIFFIAMVSFDCSDRGSQPPEWNFSDESSDSGDSDSWEVGSVSTQATSVAEEYEPSSHSGACGGHLE
ncbi:hypothetical protein FB45DRAFT_868594 [Roridomyces roridus]|uniref:Uncharacterized protein n=1 Tax=Roridomyces roridus TaxID=1738132 RepID=A0AAD7BQA0_9AGAR|nr:hypothetical protein FB45DRAFT_868594 [Roridomyces roridus]